MWRQVHRVITSTEKKAIVTAAPAAGLWRLPVEQRAAFDEVHRAGYIEDYENTVRAFFSTPERAPAGWESALQAQARAVSALEDLLALYPRENLALVGHGLLWTLVRAFLRSPWEETFDVWRNIQQPDLAVWQRQNQGWRLVQDFGGLEGVEMLQAPG